MLVYMGKGRAPSVDGLDGVEVRIGRVHLMLNVEAIVDESDLGVVLVGKLRQSLM